MKKIIAIFVMTFAFAVAASAQEKMGEGAKPTDADKAATFDSKGKIARGAAIGNSKVVSLKNVLKDPSKFAGKPVRIKGFVVRSCKGEGCWAEIGDTKDAKNTVRVTMKDHNFFIPLASAGLKVLTEGTVNVTTLPKEKVEHLIKEDGAKFEKINEDGTVTEVTFVASGIELSKAK